CRRDRPDAPDVQDVAESAKALQCPERSLDGIGRQQSRRLHLSPQPRQDLLIEDWGRRPRQSFIDDEADRVRAYVDDGDRRPVVKPALRNDGEGTLTLLR